MGMMLGTLRRRLGEHGYSVWAVARKRDMPKGHTIADMADDYAELFRDEFEGRVDVVLGVSLGGHVGLALAAPMLRWTAPRPMKPNGDGPRVARRLWRHSCRDGYHLEGTVTLLCEGRDARSRP
jgi:hypothetical protein